MKQILLTCSSLALCLVVLAACGSTSSSPSVSSSAPSVAVSPSVSSSAASVASSVSASAAPAEDNLLKANLAILSEVAGLGDSIAVSEIDLQAAGLDITNVASFVGAESRLSSENGGIVMLFQMQPGTAGDMATALAAYRDARAGDDRYAEFATARENTAEARIVEKDDLVVYAVSATGHEGGYAPLDSAIDLLA